MNSNKNVVFILTLYIVQSLNMVVKIFIDQSSPLWNFISVVGMGTIFIVFLLTIPSILKKNGIVFFLSHILLLFIFITSIIQNIGMLPDLIYVYLWAIISLSCVFYIYSIYDIKLLYKRMYQISFFIVPVLSLGLILYTKNNESSYNMSLSYMIVVPFLFLIDSFFKSIRFYKLIIIITVLLIIILFGARGPLISIFFFIFIISLSNTTNYRKILFILASFTISTILLLNLNSILIYTANTLDRINFSSRNIRLLLSDYQFYNSGRTELFNYYLRLISEKPIFGWGILGGWIDISNGPHNMLIELLLSFGLIFGSIIILFIICIFLHSIIISIRNKQYSILLIFSSSIVPLFFVSGNIYEKYNLFIFLGIYLWIIKKGGRK